MHFESVTREAIFDKIVQMIQERRTYVVNARYVSQPEEHYEYTVGYDDSDVQQVYVVMDGVEVLDFVDIETPDGNSVAGSDALWERGTDEHEGYWRLGPLGMRLRNGDGVTFQARYTETEDGVGERVTVPGVDAVRITPSGKEFLQKAEAPGSGPRIFTATIVDAEGNELPPVTLRPGDTLTVDVKPVVEPSPLGADPQAAPEAPVPGAVLLPEITVVDPPLVRSDDEMAPAIIHNMEEYQAAFGPVEVARDDEITVMRGGPTPELLRLRRIIDMADSEQQTGNDTGSGITQKLQPDQDSYLDQQSAWAATLPRGGSLPWLADDHLYVLPDCPFTVPHTHMVTTDAEGHLFKSVLYLEEGQ